MKIIEMEDDVWEEFQRKATHDAGLRGLIALVRVRGTSAEASSIIGPNSTQRGRRSRMATATDSGNNGMSPRALGHQVRHRYATERGMKPHGGIVYEHNGVEVVMPFATERNPDRWFLGAPVTTLRKGKRQFLILLCWKDNAELDFVIPPEKVADFINRLTLNSNGQFMFNVAKKGDDHYQLLVPGSPLDITKYLHAKNLLNGK